MTHSPKVIGSRKRSTSSGVTWLVCARCGLVYLRNAATAQAIRQPCRGLDDPPKVTT